jgi:hypothetical protein
MAGEEERMRLRETARMLKWVVITALHVNTSLLWLAWKACRESAGRSSGGE